MRAASRRDARRRRSTGSRAGSSSVQAAGPLSPEVREIGGGLGWVAGCVRGLQGHLLRSNSSHEAAHTTSHLHEWHTAPYPYP